MRAPGRALKLGCACALVAACGGSSTTTVLVIPDGSTNPGLMDGGLGIDASFPESDASVDGSVLKGAECSGLLQELNAVHTAGRAFSLSTTSDSIDVVHLVPACGGTLGVSPAQGLMFTSMSSSGTPRTPIPLVGGESADCDQTSLPALAAGKESVSVFYASNHGLTGKPQVFYKDALSDSAPVQFTMNDERTIEDLVVRIDNKQMLELVQAREGVISALRTSTDTRSLTTSSDGYHVAQLAVTNVGTAATNTLAALAWVSDSTTTPGIYVGFYDTSGGLAGPTLLSANVRSQSSVALATQTARAAVIYSDDTGATFLHTLEQDKTVGDAVRLTSGNQEVGDVALARYGIGYIVAYRSVTLGGGQSVIRILAIDEHGNQAGTRFIAETRADGRGLDIRVTNDGRIVVSWAEPATVQDPVTGGTLVETKVRIARLTCL